MTEEELKKVPFRETCHMAMEGEYTTTYMSKDGRLGYCDHVPRDKYGMVKKGGRAVRERRRKEKGMKTHAERLAEMEAEIEEQLAKNERPDGLVVKLRDLDDSIDIETSWPKAKLADYIPFVKTQLADCYETFDAFRKKHPEFHEMHFMTEQTVWEKDLEE